MKKLALITFGSLLATSAFAADLNNTQWKTIDDESGKAKAIVEFKKQSNGSYTASIAKQLDTTSKKTCDACSGSLKGKPIEGLTIVQNLNQTQVISLLAGQFLIQSQEKLIK